MARRNKKIRLDGGSRSTIFAGLSTYHAAAVDLSRLDSLEACPASISRDMIKSMALGRPLSEAGRRAGLFNTTEAMLLAIGEASSRQVLVYRWLALWYDDNAHFTAVLQRQMFYPMAVTAIAFITEPLAAVFRQELSLTAYLLTLTLQLTLVIGSYRWLIRYLRYRQVQYFNEPWFAAVLSGAVSQTSFLRKVYERNYLKLLWLMLDAGLDAQQSLAKLAKLSRNAKWRRRHSDAARLLQAGQPLHSTLATSALLSRPDNLGVLSSAEQSGTISKALGHHLGLLDDSIQQQFEVRASWAGRLLYFGILLFVAVVFFA